MALHEINCEDCGRPRKTKLANTKYCVICRLSRNLKFIGTRTQKCPVCGERFAPLHRNEVMCGKCDPINAVGSPEDECGFCHEHKPLIVDMVKVCHPCATDPKNREQFQIALRRRIKEAKDEYLV